MEENWRESGPWVRWYDNITAIVCTSSIVDIWYFVEQLDCPSRVNFVRGENDRQHIHVSATERANYPEEPRGVVSRATCISSPSTSAKSLPKKRSREHSCERNPASGLVIGAGSKDVVTLGVVQTSNNRPNKFINPRSIFNQPKQLFSPVPHE